MTDWTHYWQRDTVDNHRTMSEQGHRSYSVLDHTASNLFGPPGKTFRASDSKIKPGDSVYCISNYEGQFRLLGRLLVGDVVDMKTATAKLKTSNLWKAKWHLLARPSTVKRIQFDLILPLRDVKKIRFIRNGVRVAPVFLPNGQPDRQTFRSVRELSQETADMFNAALGL